MVELWHLVFLILGIVGMWAALLLRLHASTLREMRTGPFTGPRLMRQMSDWSPNNAVNMGLKSSIWCWIRSFQASNVMLCVLYRKSSRGFFLLGIQHHIFMAWYWFNVSTNDSWKRYGLLNFRRRNSYLHWDMIFIGRSITNSYFHLLLLIG